MTLSNREQFIQTFYSRQVNLKELGEKGQQKLCNAKVAVVGVGGLGTVASLYLALAGVGYLRVIDQDIVELQNLHRQILYTPEDVDYPKAEAAAKRLTKLNPLVQVEAASENVNAENVERLLTDVDVVVDGLDNMGTRYLVNRTCVKRGIPYVFGAAIGMEGNLSVFTPQTPCLECVLPNLSDNELMTCDTRGVIGATPGIVGSMEALEAIKLIAGFGEPLTGKLMICDFTDMTFNTIDISKRANCPACQGAQQPAIKQHMAWLCGQETANINPDKPLKLNLAQVYEVVQQLSLHVHVKSNLALMFDYKGLEVSLFGNGRMLIKNVKNENEALQAYKEIAAILHLT